MAISRAAQQLRDKYLETLRQAVYPLQTGPDAEVELEALIEATQLLQARLEEELAELRQEQTD